METYQKAAFYEFVREYLDGALDLFEKDQPTSDFSRGYQQALRSLHLTLKQMGPPKALGKVRTKIDCFNGARKAG